MSTICGVYQTETQRRNKKLVETKNQIETKNDSNECKKWANNEKKHSSSRETFNQKESK